MSPPSTQDNLDAAAAFLRNFVTAQQQQQQATPAPAPQAPSQTPQPQTPTYLQQLVLAAQQYQQPPSAAAPAPQAQPQPPAQPPHAVDPNIAHLLAQAMNMAQQQNQRQAGNPPSAAPVAPAPQTYPPMPHQPYGSVPPTTSPPVVSSQQTQQQNLLASAQLLGSLNPTLAAALMSSALQQTTAPAPAATASAAPATSKEAEPVATHPPPPPRPVPPLPIPYRMAGTSAFHRPPPVMHPITKMQQWSLEQLEAHAKELQESGYQLPQAVAILLADARRKEEKRQAKRIANRKSACTSRARKKAKIDQLMNENAQLRRLELILSYLPDPIIVVSPTGVVTFCNAQVERVFKHKVNELLGANIEDVLIPKSRVVIKKLIRDMLVAEQELSENVSGDAAIAKKKMKSKNGEGSGSGDRNLISENTSESAFPLLEVKLNSTDVDAAEDFSDSDENRRLASLAHKDSTFNSNEADDTTPNSSEKEMRNALAKNVEACKINKEKAKTEQVRFAHKDDVMGSSVTANNADAKLSSLMHEPSSMKTDEYFKPFNKQEEQSSSTLDSSLSKTSIEKAQAKEGNFSEDSGYRESGESPVDSNSSSSSGVSDDSKNEKCKRARPMAPSRNVCMIRSDLSSIWCELTSSIRTSIVVPDEADKDKASVSKEVSMEAEETEQLEKEILLCFRPIQEGEKVSSDLKLNRVVKHGISESSGDAATSSTQPASTETQLDAPKKSKPPKKRMRPNEMSSELAKKNGRVASDETSAVETMMELARKCSSQ